MCLAIYKPAELQVSEEFLRNGYSNHSDGAGFAWAVDGVLHVRKGIFDVEEVIKQYELVKDYPCLIHFRKATHGKVDATNTHPFVFAEGKYALIHNGVLNIKCSIEGLSDTAHFVKLVLEPLVMKYNIPINDGCLHYLLSTSINTDKMAIMNGEGKCFIVNADKGTWEGGVWYSNTSFRYSYKTTSSSSSSTGTYYNGQSRHSQYPSQGSTARNYDNHKNWRKRWEDDTEGDASYLEFWKRAIPEQTDCGDCCPIDGNPNKKTQRLPKLLTDGNSSSSHTLTLEEVEALTDEQIEELSNGKKKEETTGPGHMMEYGWWDEQIERDVEIYMTQFNLTREQSIVRVFND